MTTLKKNYFYRVFCYFPFFVFFFFCFYFPTQKRKNKKCNFLFENLIFDNPKFCNNTILTHCDTICVTEKAKNTIKLGKTAKKNLDQFLTYKLDQFLTYKTPNLGPVFNFTAHIYIYVVESKICPRFAFFESKICQIIPFFHFSKIVFFLQGE